VKIQGVVAQGLASLMIKDCAGVDNNGMDTSCAWLLPKPLHRMTRRMKAQRTYQKVPKPIWPTKIQAKKITSRTNESANSLTIGKPCVKSAIILATTILSTSLSFLKA